MRALTLLRQLRLGWEFRQRRPWVCRIDVDGFGYGGSYIAEDDARLATVDRAFPDAHTILDLGCLDGGSTFVLARRTGARVTGVDPRADNIERARFAQRVLGIENAVFVQHDVETTPLITVGNFDALVSLGLLAHVPNPGDVLDDLAAVTTRLFLWTHCCADDEVDDEVDGLPGRWVRERGGHDDPLSGLSPLSFWPTAAALLERVGRGFADVEVVTEERDHPHGPAVTLVGHA